MKVSLVSDVGIGEDDFGMRIDLRVGLVRLEVAAKMQFLDIQRSSMQFQSGVVTCW